MTIATLFVAHADRQAAHDYAEILAATNGTPDDVLTFFLRVARYAEGTTEAEIEAGAVPVGWIEAGECPQYLLDGFNLVTYVEVVT